MDLSAFQTWQFLAACIAISALVETLKRATLNVRPELAARGWFKAWMTSQNLVWGASIAALPGFLAGRTFGERLVVGICAGFLSITLYHAVVKRLMAAFVGRAAGEGTSGGAEAVEPVTKRERPSPAAAADGEDA